MLIALNLSFQSVFFIFVVPAKQIIHHIGITLSINIIHQSVRLSDSMCFSWHHMYSLNNNTQVYEENNQILFSFDMEKCALIVLILVCFFKNLQY